MIDNSNSDMFVKLICTFFDHFNLNKLEYFQIEDFMYVLMNILFTKYDNKYKKIIIKKYKKIIYSMLYLNKLFFRKIATDYNLRNNNNWMPKKC